MVLTLRIGGISCSADSGVSVGVTVIPIGPPTINDFNYSNLNLSQPSTDSGSVKGTTSDTSTNPVTNSDTIDGTANNGATNSTDQSTNGNLLKSTNSNSINAQTEQKDSQGTVKGAKTEANPNWFKKLFNRCVDFFENLFK